MSSVSSGRFTLTTDRSRFPSLKRDLLDRNCSEFVNIFTNPVDNKQLGRVLLQEGFIDNRELHSKLIPNEINPGEWGNALFDVIRGLPDDESICQCFVTLSNPEKTNLRSYSNNIRTLLRNAGVSVTEEVSGRQTDRSENSQIHRADGYSSVPGGASHSNPRRYMMVKMLVIGALLMLVGTVLLVCLDGKCYPGNLSSEENLTEANVLFTTTTPLISLAHYNNSDTSHSVTKTNSNDSNADNSSKNPHFRYVPITSPIVEAPVTSKIVTKPPSKTRKSRKRLKPLPMYIESCASYEFWLPKICDPNIKSLVILSNSNPHAFQSCHFDCSERIYGLIFLNANLPLSEVANITSAATNLRYLNFTGPNICIRSKGELSLPNTFPETRFPKLTTLVFQDLWDNNGVDCAELFYWLGSNKVRNLAAPQVKLSNTSFTDRNKPDLTHLIGTKLSKLETLDIVRAHIHTVMFGEGFMQPKNLSVRFYSQRPSSQLSQESQYNFLSQFTRGSNISKYFSNIIFSKTQFQSSLPAIRQRNMDSLKAGIEFKEWEPEISFEYLENIPNIKEFIVMLHFEVDRNASVVLTGFDYLQNNTNSFRRFEVFSNAKKLLVRGASDLMCRKMERSSDGELDIVGLSVDPKCERMSLQKMFPQD